MDKWRQQFSIGYFFVALLLLFLLQTYLASPQIETINYSQFKALVKTGLVANLVVGEKAIHGEIKEITGGRAQQGARRTGVASPSP